MNLRSVRQELRAWGLYWHHRAQAGHDYAPTSPSHSLVEIARLGCRVQVSGWKDITSEAIVPPTWVCAIDRAVETLPPTQRAAVCLRYIRRRPANHRALLRGEKGVLEVLGSPPHRPSPCAYVCQ